LRFQNSAQTSDSSCLRRSLFFCCRLGLWQGGGEGRQLSAVKAAELGVPQGLCHPPAPLAPAAGPRAGRRPGGAGHPARGRAARPRQPPGGAVAGGRRGRRRRGGERKARGEPVHQRQVRPERRGRRRAAGVRARGPRAEALLLRVAVAAVGRGRGRGRRRGLRQLRRLLPVRRLQPPLARRGALGLRHGPAGRGPAVRERRCRRRPAASGRRAAPAGPRAGGRAARTHPRPAGPAEERGGHPAVAARLRALVPGPAAPGAAAPRRGHARLRRGGAAGGARRPPGEGTGWVPTTGVVPACRRQLRRPRLRPLARRGVPRRAGVRPAAGLGRRAGGRRGARAGALGRAARGAGPRRGAARRRAAAGLLRPHRTRRALRGAERRRVRGEGGRGPLRERRAVHVRAGGLLLPHARLRHHARGRRQSARGALPARVAARRRAGPALRHGCAPRLRPAAVAGAASWPRPRRRLRPRDLLPAPRRRGLRLRRPGGGPRRRRCPRARSRGPARSGSAHRGAAGLDPGGQRCVPAGGPAAGGPHARLARRGVARGFARERAPGRCR
ncbi:unnamed protein product, partial [Prorocentrum cordatum]